MDERRKTIRSLEEKKREVLHDTDALLQNLGEKLLAKFNSGERLPEEVELNECVNSYRKFLRVIADDEAGINAIAAEVERRNAMEADIQKKSRDSALLLRETHEDYYTVGEAAVKDVAFDDIIAPFRQQMDIYVPKIQSLQERLENLSDREHENLISKIGKNAQGVVLRSTLSKNQDALKKILTQAGEAVVKSGQMSENSTPEFSQSLTKAREALDRANAITAELNGLRESCEQITARYAKDGSPSRKTQTLRRNIATTQGEMKRLSLNFGLLAEGGKYTSFFEGFIATEDKRTLGKIAENRTNMADFDSKIAKLKASLAIDAEQAEIEKMNRQIRDWQSKIAAAQESIEGLNREIAESEKKIQELQKI
jgi:hypothetical protein